MSSLLLSCLRSSTRGFAIETWNTRRIPRDWACQELCRTTGNHPSSLHEMASSDVECAEVGTVPLA